MVDVDVIKATACLFPIKQKRSRNILREVFSLISNTIVPHSSNLAKRQRKNPRAEGFLITVYVTVTIRVQHYNMRRFPSILLHYLEKLSINLIISAVFEIQLMRKDLLEKPV